MYEKSLYEVMSVEATQDAQSDCMQVGEFDPITRKAMKANHVTPNVALRNATLQYLQEHPWAWAECC